MNRQKRFRKLFRFHEDIQIKSNQILYFRSSDNRISSKFITTATLGSSTLGLNTTERGGEQGANKRKKVFMAKTKAKLEKFDSAQC